MTTTTMYVACPAAGRYALKVAEAHRHSAPPYFRLYSEERREGKAYRAEAP